MAAGTSPRVQSAGWLSTQRLTLAPEALVAETRDPLTGVWSPGRSVFYDEICAVYTFRTPDWGYLVVAALYGSLGSVLVLIAGLTAGWSRTAWGIAVGALLALLGLLAAYRVFLRQQDLVRLDAASGPLQFASRDAAFLEQLRGRLTEAAPVEEAADTFPRGNGTDATKDGATAPEDGLREGGAAPQIDARPTVEGRPYTDEPSGVPPT